MRDVLMKLRIKLFTLCLHLGLFFDKIINPIKILCWCIKRSLDLRKIDKENEDNWERYVKRKELEKKDELILRREQFYLLKVHIIGSLCRASIIATYCIEFQNRTEESNEFYIYKKEFQQDKEELVNLIEQLCEYNEITFDEEIKSDILSWELDKFKSQETLENWIKIVSDYICTLDIL